jgi:hypothetical protein
MAMMTQTHGSIGHSFRPIDRWVPGDVPHHTRTHRSVDPDALRGGGYAEPALGKGWAREAPKGGFGMLDRSTRTIEVGAWPAAVSPSPQRIRWGAVFAGVVLGTALLALLATLWFALAFNSDVQTVRVDLEWYVGITAIVCLFTGGLLAGWLSGVRGAGAGFFTGLTVWGMILIVALAVGIPAIYDVFNLGRISAVTDGAVFMGSGLDARLWVSFWTILGGFLAAGLGGMIGGAVTMPANAQLAPIAERTVDEEREFDEDDVDEDIDADRDEMVRYRVP